MGVVDVFGDASVIEQRKGEYAISTDTARIDVDAVADYLSRSYWAAGRSREQIERSLAHSICFGLYHDGRQVGFARVISDHATFAYLCDVYVLEAHRGNGLGKWLVDVVLAHPELQGLRRWMLATRDAHELYRQFGFAELSNPDRWMEIFNGGRAGSGSSESR